jgi:hypothetical protein
MAEPSPYRIKGDAHALRAGYVWGLAMKHGLRFTPELDEDGNYAASAILELPEPAFGVRVRLVVSAEEPPGD